MSYKITEENIQVDSTRMLLIVSFGCDADDELTWQNLFLTASNDTPLYSDHSHQGSIQSGHLRSGCTKSPYRAQFNFDMADFENKGKIASGSYIRIVKTFNGTLNHVERSNPFKLSIVSGSESDRGSNTNDINWEVTNISSSEVSFDLDPSNSSFDEDAQNFPIVPGTAFADSIQGRLDSGSYLPLHLRHHNDWNIMSLGEPSSSNFPAFDAGSPGYNNLKPIIFLRLQTFEPHVKIRSGQLRVSAGKLNIK